MNKKTRLELTWIGKDARPRLEPRILVEDADLSHHASVRSSGGDIFDNMLVHGDNLLSLKALEANPERFKLIYIDPPYNTGSAFSHYDDGLEHSLWLSLMRDRLEVMHRLLLVEGSLWVSIDDSEYPYLRVLLDEIFGRENFVASCIWQKRYSRENRETIGDAHEYVLVYARNIDRFKAVRNRVPLDQKSASVYKNPNRDPRGRWRGIPMTAQGYRPNQMYPITSPSGAIHYPPEGRCWSTIEENFNRLRAEGRVYFGKNGDSQPSIIRYLSEVEGLVPWTWWPHEEVGHTDEAKKESQVIFGKENVFPTPKPERLIKRIIEIATNPGDLVLDTFAGSGTTGAVAHKMGRRWIMVELGDHAVSHIVPRLKKVIDDDDPGGITEATGWQGGGGFRFYRLAPSLLQRDRFGNWVIAKEYNASMLAEALCKHLGFTYAPSQDPAEYWRHGHSTETDFIYVTTQSLTYDALKKLAEEVGPKRTLLVCCKAFNANEDSFQNLTVKKIPHSILAKCEWGRDDYSLRIANLPEKVAVYEATEPRGRRASKSDPALPLFDMPGGK
jgi:adenine-specific DNA-methyltransferase